ncbi:MAG: hypothetical protein AB7O62_05875, partial [Pirellulales bacterium]
MHARRSLLALAFVLCLAMPGCSLDTSSDAGKAADKSGDGGSSTTAGSQDSSGDSSGSKSPHSEGTGLTLGGMKPSESDVLALEYLNDPDTVKI